jgi:hypothetical protein
MQRLISALCVWIAAALVVVPNIALGADATGMPVSAAQQINVTTDSTPGWLPSQEQIRLAGKTAEDFLAAKDGGRPAEAYAFLADINKQNQPLAEFSGAILKFNARAGSVKERRIVAVTWTKDPVQAPLPGVYAAMDLVSRFANVDRYCGFLVLYQAPAGGDFRVMREEDNFIDNVTAKTIVQQHSQADLDKTWVQLSAHCPNYPSAPPAPLPEQSGATIGYPMVAIALQQLRSRPGVEISSRAGWTIANDAAAATVWSFPPPGDPAYPAAVKRQVVKAGNGSDIEMNILCESTKAACDNLVRQFEALNAQMKASLSAR